MNVNLFKFYNNHNQGNHYMKQRNTKLTQEEFDERMKNINPNQKKFIKNFIKFMDMEIIQKNNF